MLPSENYHLFNHANGRENLFVEKINYPFFLEKLAKYVLPVCKIFSYCMMPNHFHLALQVRTEEALTYLWKKENEATPFTQKQLELKISKTFGNLFSSYTQAFNKSYDRKGSLFIPSMKTHEIGSEQDLCKLIHYIHSNPVHHSFSKSIEDWPHSSYRIFLSEAPTKLERQYVLDLFGGKDAFIKYHQQPIDIKLKHLQ